MKVEQEPKYDVRDGSIINRATGEAIPDDEPVFIFRAKDIRAVGILKRYQQGCTDPAHREAISQRIADFEEFARTQYGRMKEPDTTPGEGEAP
jgi:hypothetical protein